MEFAKENQFFRNKDLVGFLNDKYSRETISKNGIA